MRAHRRPAAIAALVSAGLLGCASGIPSGIPLVGRHEVAIRGVEPGAVELGTIRHLVILDGEGRPSARAFVFQELVHQARTAGYFRAQDRSAEGHTVQVVGQRADLDRGLRRMPKGQAGMRIDIVEWSTQRELRPVTTEGADGVKVTEHVPVRHGKVVLSVTVFDSTGRAHLAERDFEGRSEVKKSATRKAALADAARDAVARVLEEISPRVVTQRVRLDADDPEQEPIVKLASAGSVAKAADDLTRYFQQNPSSPSAAYNLAVLLDAQGRYEQALPLYERALRLGGQSYYHEAREGCTRRLAARRALAAGPVPASLREALR